MRYVFVLIGFFAAFATPAAQALEMPRPIAVVYRGEAGCEGCSEAVGEMLEKSKFRFKVIYAGPREAVQVNDETLEGAIVYAQPGGGDDTELALSKLGPGAVAAVRSFVARGGRYLGICMGAYLAGSPGFALIDGVPLQYWGRPGALVADYKGTVTPVVWGGKQRFVYYESGSTVVFRPTAKNVQVLASYPNKDVAVSITPFGRGKVALSGPHPEADKSWYESQGLVNPDGYKTDLGEDLIAAMMTP